MTGLKEVTNHIDVPANTGVDGYLQAIREILRVPRVQRVVLDSTGRVTYTRLSESDGSEEDVRNVGVSFEHLQPYSVIRNSAVQELSYPRAMGGADVVAAMFDATTGHGYTPICFAVGVGTILYNWLYLTAGVELSNPESLFGYPVLVDERLDKEILVLCAGLGSTRALVDTRFSLKVVMRNTTILSADEEMVL